MKEARLSQTLYPPLSLIIQHP